MAESRRVRLRLPLWKKVTYSVAVTIVSFALIEAAIAFFGFASNQASLPIEFESARPLFVEQEHDDARTYLQTAKDKLPYFNAQRFPKDKPENTFRIVCLGGSTTYGRPYNDATSYVGWLRELLRVAAPDCHWEVINAGGISYASYRVAAVMEELCLHSPDLFIVYTGHNEFLEERTYREVNATPEEMRRLNGLLQQTRTYSLFRRLLSPPGFSSDRRWLLPGEVDTILDHEAGPTSYHRDDALRADILQQFEFNLAKMDGLARAGGAEMMLITPAANLKDFSPFKSEHRADLGATARQQWSKLFIRAGSLESADDLSGAVTALDQAAEIDDRYAFLHYRRGCLLFAQHRFAEARQAFLRAVDEDVCPLRVLPAMQDVVRNTAISRGIPLVDYDSILRNDCQHHFGHDSPGDNYFLDHVHPTIEAHRLLAVAIFEAMVQGGIVTPNELWRDDAVEFASRHIEARVDPEMQARALMNLAQVLSWAGKQQEAGPIALDAVVLRKQHGMPEDAECLLYAGVYLATIGEDEQAIELLGKVAELQSADEQVHWRLASLFYDQRRYDDAKRHFLEAVRLNPDDTYSRQMLEDISSKLKARQFEDSAY